MESFRCVTEQRGRSGQTQTFGQPDLVEHVDQIPAHRSRKRHPPPDLDEELRRVPTFGKECPGFLERQDHLRQTRGESDNDDLSIGGDTVEWVRTALHLYM